MKDNRRNFYRVLQVQPDAPLYTIKNNYRTLLHKLRLHPDLGGNNDTASAINLAYATLRNSTKRAAYDLKLLNKYKIEVLSKGYLSRLDHDHQIPRNIPSTTNINKRHYYRVLHIQSDAPAAIISTSYQMLLKKQGAPVELIEEAYSVLSDPRKRLQYDRLLKQGKHIHIKRSAAKKKYYAGESSPYRPLITHYCYFCKTPQNIGAIEYVDDFCIECSSPLYSTVKQSSSPHRFFSRVELNTAIAYHTFWPSHQMEGILTNLSPTGLCFRAKHRFNENQVIKMGSDKFNAVGEVRHQKTSKSFNMIGIEFIVIKFNTENGAFISASA